PHIVAVLTGASGDKVVERGHDALPVFGAGAGRTGEAWRATIRQMTSAGLLVVDAAFGSLQSGPRAAAFRAGTIGFVMRPEAAAKPTARARRAAAALPKNVDPALFAALKQKRRELAEEREVPAFVIFSDRTLADMAAKKPTSLAAFGEVFGVGRAKTEAFGAAFIAVIRADAREA
ncbi:MAG: HRDC domain-containing protein, partial [Parvularculaceae bacterium]|nr:HRDC domain-containing protein [Parvularculaceae bacterium]